jgi:hypothetical protein
MKSFRRALVTLVALGSVTQFVCPVAAETQLQSLETAREEVTAAARHERQRRVFDRGGPRWRTTSKGRELRSLEGDLNHLISDLEQGRAVSPAEIDRALRQAESLR